MSANIETEQGQRKVARRGLIAGLAGLGAAAMLKVSGAGKPGRAEAAATALLIPGAVGDAASNNTAYQQTNLSLYSGVQNLSVLFLDASGATSGARNGLSSFAGGNAGVGIITYGSGGGTPAGYGVAAYGGNGNSGIAGSPGVRSVGGVGGAGAVGGAGIVAIGGLASAKYGDGVQASSLSGKGVFGQSSTSDGVHGTSNNGVGLRGTSHNFVGLVGISDNNIGLYGYTVAPNVPAFYAEHLGPFGRIAGRFYGDVQVIGNFTVSGGAKNAAVPMPDGSEALVYCQESPEPYFEDFGRARLVNGHARVQIEPEFASIVKRDDYMVFFTPEGEIKHPLYISQRNANGFEVREANGGKSDLPFTYRIVARRKDIEGKRLARLDPKLKQNIAKMRGESATKMPSTAMIGRTEAPLVPHDPILPVELPKPDADRRR